MIIRKATSDDIFDLIQLRIDYLTEHFGSLNDAQQAQIRAQLPGYFRAHLPHDFIAYIAQTNNHAIATAFLVVQEKPANPRFLSGRTGLLLNVYTIKEYRRRGIAKQLMNRIIDDARNLALSSIELTATEAGKPLYNNLGFVQNDRHDDMILILSK